jgi:DNA-binding NarL/FixJ family response regulator
VIENRQRHSLRTLVIEPNPALRERLHALLSADPAIEVVGEAEGRAKALALLRLERPLAAVVDVGVGGRAGLDLVAEMRRESPGLALVAMARDADAELAERCRRLGADRWLSGAAELERVAEAVRAAAAGRGRQGE